MLEKLLNLYSNRYYKNLIKKINDYDEVIKMKKDKIIVLKDRQIKEEEELKKLNSLKVEYRLKGESLLKTMETNGVVWKLQRHNILLEPWDNLTLHRINDIWGIYTMKKEQLYLFKKEETRFIDDILKGYKYGIVVVGVEGSHIKVQFRLSPLQGA